MGNEGYELRTRTFSLRLKLVRLFCIHCNGCVDGDQQVWISTLQCESFSISVVRICISLWVGEWPSETPCLTCQLL